MEERNLRETEAKEAERRRRRDKEKETSRPRNSERRKSHMDEDPEARRARHEERRSRRASEYRPTTITSNDRADDPKPIVDYFDERNGTSHRRRGSHITPTNGESSRNRPYLSKSGDKTSSWIDSLSNEPPLPPPVESTVLDPPPGARQGELVDEESPSADENIRLRIAGRRGKHREHREKDSGKEKERDRKRDSHRRRSGGEGLKSSDDDKDKNRRRGYAYPPAVAFDTAAPVKTWDGRPAPAPAPAGGKRNSWFKKIAGF